MFCDKCTEHKHAYVLEKQRQTNIKRYGTPYQLSRKEIHEKARLTNLEKYGVEFTSQSEEIKNKRKKTNLEKYGVEYAISSDVVKQKVKQTNLEKYGVEYVLASPEINKKARDTMLERYGGEHTMSSPILREKLKGIYQEKYGVDWPLQLKEIREQIYANNLVKYGTENPITLPEMQEYMRQRVAEIYGVDNVFVSDEFKKQLIERNQRLYGVDHYNQSTIPYESYLILNDPECLKKWHHDDQMTLSAIGDKLNVSATTVGRYFMDHDIEVKFFYTSNAEREIGEELDLMGVDYVSRDRNQIDGKYNELDLYIPSAKLAIEHNGLFWHSEKHKRIDKNYHKLKHDKCHNNGIRLLSIFEHEWIYKRDIIIDKLKTILNVSDKPKVYARKCLIRSVKTVDKRLFFEDNHIQGDGPSSINYGLYHDNQLVACIGFIKQKDHFVLNRYATSCNVVGGFTKLLTHFEREYDKPKIVTFADLRWSEGDLYKNTGFMLDKELAPDYYWVKGMKLWHKFNWRHTSGLKKLENYDPNLTEVENMHNHGYYRIWDCGKLRFTKN